MKIPKKIENAILKNQLIVFVGSGLSMKFGLPNWNKLAIDVIRIIDNPDYIPFIPVLEKKLMPPIEVLEYIKTEHGEIKSYIKNNFQIKKGNLTDLTLHEKLLDLSGKIITTNYDNAFELASNNNIIPAIYTSEFNISEINKNEESFIFKLHGSYTEPDHCIIFKENYESLYSIDNAAKEKLKSIFAEKTILFIGFGFNDSDINLIFNNLDKSFGNHNKHFILTTESQRFKEIKFLECIPIENLDEIDVFIDNCLVAKRNNKTLEVIDFTDNIQEKKSIPKIAILIPSPLDNNFKKELDNVVECFSSIESQILLGTLNSKTLESLEDFDLIIIASKIFKSKLYIEDDNLKSILLSPLEICSSIPNDQIPIVFITDEKINASINYPWINISTLKSAVIKKFVFKALKEGKLDFIEPEISIHLKDFSNSNFIKGQAIVSSIYENNKDLDIGKKCLNNVIGRIEEQSLIASKLISIIKSNKLLNIKASGGIGKTTLIQKVAYELYNRGYFKEGVNFKSCENIKSYDDFEEILISGFNLMNIINFKEYLIDNYSNSKIDLLLILDNFETVVHNLNGEDLKKVIDLLKFATDYSNIVVTSRDNISSSDDFEDIYSLTPLTTDDALALFQKEYGNVSNENEIRILRQDILEELLNNNPLAIKLVTKSRIKPMHIVELKKEIKDHFFETINEDFTSVFQSNADLNIERTKSIFQCINYSYTTLSEKEKIVFEILSLFPDGISLFNFKNCFEKKNSNNNISDKELRIIRSKSLVEDYNGTLQLQPIIRRFADFQFNKRPKVVKEKYCSDAYSFNCFILNLIDHIAKKNSNSEALKFYNNYKNNFLKVLSYIPDIEISKKTGVPEKKYLLHYIYQIDSFIVNEKQIKEFTNELNKVKEYFSDLPNAIKLLEVIRHNKIYYHKEFDNSYKQLDKLLNIEEMANRDFKKEDYIENIYKDIISNIHSMEGYTIQRINSFILNNDFSIYLDAHFFYLGVANNISRNKDGFYYFEYELMFGRLDVIRLESYIDSLYSEEHLEIMQSTYTLSKVKNITQKVIQKLVVTNPYTKGLKELMTAFTTKSNDDKIKHFEVALLNLSHIKYYYLEALYFYCLLLKDVDLVQYHLKMNEGLMLSQKFKYQYLNFLFIKLEQDVESKYEFSYNYYSTPKLENFVDKHNSEWGKVFNELEQDKFRR